MTKSRAKPKVRKNFVLPADIVEWVETYAKERNTTMTRIILDHFMALRQQTETGYAEQI